MSRRTLRDSALGQLTLQRIVVFLREPEAVFWVFAFPVLMALALGIAFRNQGPQTSHVAIESGPRSVAALTALRASKDLVVDTLSADAGALALRRGRIAVFVRVPDGAPPVIAYDPSRPETRLAYLSVQEALERGAGRTDLVRATTDTKVRPGSRYIDFLIPGLIGLNLLGTGMWGIGFPIANARQQKLLKRLVATPMRRRDFLLSLMLARMVWLALEVIAVLGFGMLAFGVEVRGSWPALILLCFVGALSFSALGLLVASRARTIEAVSGLMNFVMLPMWLLSGTFFPAERFPAFLQPFVQALPLTVVNGALRAVMNEGVGFAGSLGPIAILTAWTIVAFAVALRMFRWD